MQITRARRAVLICAALAVLGMLLFPPFQLYAYGHTVNAGFGWLLAPPRPAATVNSGALLVQFVGVAFIAALLYAATGPRSR